MILSVSHSRHTYIAKLANMDGLGRLGVSGLTTPQAEEVTSGSTGGVLGDASPLAASMPFTMEARPIQKEIPRGKPQREAL